MPSHFAIVLGMVAFLGGVHSEKISLSAAGQARERALEAAWSADLAPESKVVEYKSPIKRVVALLKKMEAELQAEADNESEMYDKMVCWCQTTEKEKTKAIADADAKDKELQAEIESRSARFGELATNIANLKEQIAADTEALKQATALREGGASEFRGDELELVQAINNLRNAIAVLSKHHGGSLLQLNSAVLSSMRAVLRDVAVKYELLLGDAPRSGSLLKAALLQEQGGVAKGGDASVSALLTALDAHGHGESDLLPLRFAEKALQEANSKTNNPAAAFLQAGATQPAGAGESYTPQSGVIFGILNQLKEDFESKLTASQQAELKSKGDYEAVAAAKTEQIAAGKAKLDELEGEHSENEKALSDAKEDLELTRKQRSADVEFLRNLKLTCQSIDKEWELRSKTRTEEIAAVNEALTILTEDDAADHLRKTVTLLQTDTTSIARAARVSAAAVLRRAARAPAFEADDLLAAWRGRRTAAPSVGAAAGPRAQLSTLAVSVQLDAFSKVKEVMDKMVAQLKTEQEDEVKFKSYCETSLNENEKATYTKTEEKEDLEAKMEQLAALIKSLEEDIAAAKTQIAETEVAIKKASESREQENAQYQNTVSDQRATQEILKKALARLAVFYKKGGALVQQTPPVQFNAYKKNAGASPVMGLIAQIIEDSKALEDEAVAGETSAQADYEKFVGDSNALIASLTEAVTEKTKAIASAKVESEDAASDHESTVGELESLAAYKADLHGECDFVLKNFSIRQAARLQEIEAIQQAKGILAGAMSAA